MELLLLSHLLMAGESSVGDMARILDVSMTHASHVISSIVKAGFAVKERKGMKVMVRPNMDSPFVQNLGRFVVIVGTYPPFTPSDLLEPESRRKVIWQMKAGEKTVEELKGATGYSRISIYNALKPLLKSGVVSGAGRKIKRYRIDRGSPLAGPLLQLVEFFESEVDLRPVLEHIASDRNVLAVSVFGSQISGRRDETSDVDVLVVVDAPKNRDITIRYAHPGLQINAFSRKGLVQLAMKEPWFLKLALDGRVLKGGVLLKALANLPSRPSFDNVVRDVRDMMRDAGRLPEKEKARILVYCIRTALAMRLFSDGKLDQAAFLDELRVRYPEFDTYRARKVVPRTVETTKRKVMEDLRHVEEKEEERRRGAHGPGTGP